MSNTTDVYWDVDGLSLHQHAWNIETMGGTRDSVPLWRGSDRKYAYKQGAQPRPRIPDSRVISLAMWVIGQNADGTVADDLRTVYDDNRRKLKKAFWLPDGDLFELTKRWYDPDSGDVLSATALGRLNNDMAPEMDTAYRGKFVVDVLLPDPFFYSDEETVDLDLDEWTEVSNPGDDRSSNLRVVFVGPLTNPRLTRQEGDIWVEYQDSIADGIHVELDISDATATRLSDDANVIGKVDYHGTHRSWFRLLRGASTLKLTADAGTGHCLFHYRAPYF